ncbi:MAG: hypothetical protein M1497_07950 [Nitrospirae bacterium]|nr:hypothetical protein [Nitrospirota bacterium]
MVLFRTLSALIAAAALVLTLRPALSAYFSSGNPGISKEGISVAGRITEEDARYHSLSGLLAYASRDNPDPVKAAERYLEALRRNPTDSQTWLAVSRAYRDSGKREEAGYAALKAVYFDRDNPVLIWEAAVFFLLDGKTGESARLFRRYLSMIPGDQENVYSLCYTMGVAPGDILNEIVPQAYAFYQRYLRFLIANRLLNESLEAWEKMKRYNPGREDFLRYADFLIGSGETEKALALWKDFIKRFRPEEAKKEAEEYLSGDRIWNGDFELPIENGGYDWRLGRSGDVRIFTDRDVKREGDSSLSVNFDGSSNPDIYIARQIVPVEPGRRYRLNGYIKTDKLTTQNGLELEVSGLLCGPFAVRSEPVTGTNMWKEVELEFLSPQACRTVQVGVRRERSLKFDNRISGDAWIDSVTMIEEPGT